MPNMIERELQAVHTTIAELERKQRECVNVRHYIYLDEEKQKMEKKRRELLEQLEVEY